MIDYHCHITTPGSRMPETDGEYYKTLKPLVKSGEWLSVVWQETIETMAESLRTPEMLRGYRQMLPLVYSEMSRRMMTTSGDRLMVEMAKCRVRQACVVALDPYVPSDELVDVCLKTKDILVPFASVDPWADDWHDRLKGVLAQPICGFKFHFALQQLPFGHPRMHEIVDVIATTRPALPIFLHTGDFPIYKPLGEDWGLAMDAFLNQFPTLTFVCGHAGWNRPSAAMRAARHHPNLYLETSWQPPVVIRRLCGLLGPRRLLLGSDFPLFSMRRAIRNCKLALTPEEFAFVSEANAKELIERGRNSLPS